MEFKVDFAVDTKEEIKTDIDRYESPRPANIENAPVEVEQIKQKDETMEASFSSPRLPKSANNVDQSNQGD
jgi:hypothetical protein